MRCEKLEHLESVLENALNRQEELVNRKLATIRSGEPDSARFDSKTAKAYRASESSAEIIAGA